MEIKIPYRINWAGAYLDCIEEPVITSVIDKYITVNSVASLKPIIEITSKEFNETYIANLEPICPLYKNTWKWTDYVDACIAVFAMNDIKLSKGFKATVDNDLPCGIGVSSSAAFIIALLKTISYHNKLDLDDSVIASFGYWVEHDALLIPSGRMDFKAVLHNKGIWKINTDTSDLSSDKCLDTELYNGLLIYKETHNNSSDLKFLENAVKIRNTKLNLDINPRTTRYINWEETIVTSIWWRAGENNLSNMFLGSALVQSNANLKLWLGLENQSATIDFNWEGVYGAKIVGSGLRGAYFILIDLEKQEEIIKKLKEDNWNIIVCNL